MKIKKLTLLLAALLPALVFAQVPAPAEADKVDQPAPQKQVSPFSRDLEVPYISTYYVQPVVTIGSMATVPYYVTDWHQSEIRFGDKSHRFNITLEVITPSGKTFKFSPKNRPAGDHQFRFPVSEPGIYKISLQAVDARGRRSNVLIHEIWGRTEEEQKIPAAQTMTVSQSDLEKYGISNKDVPVVMIPYEIPATVKEINDLPVPLAKQSEEIAAKNAAKVPANGYMIVTAAHKAPANLLKNDGSCGAYNLPTPEWIPYAWTCKSGKVVYGKNYNAEKVEADAVKTGTGLNKLLADAKAAGMRKVVLPKGIYRVSHKTTINIPSGMTLDLNGATIKLNQFAGSGALIIRMVHCYDSHVMNGIVEGDYFEHYYDKSPHNSEWVCGIGIEGDSRYCSYKNLVVRHITGYGVTNGFKDGFSWGIGLKDYKRGTIDRRTGTSKFALGVWTSGNYANISKLRDSVGYLTASKILGYQGRALRSWNLEFHFFDKQRKYLETIEGWQYRRTRIPKNAEFVRVTVVSDTDPSKSGVAVNMFKIPWNCAFENIYIQNARCVGMAPSAMFNMKIANCSFVRCGESSATCAFDAEDGWDMMQDVWIYRNRFLMNPRNELLTCAGHNFIIEENEASIHLWSRTAGYVIRNNKVRSASYGFRSRGRTLLPRIENNNTYTGSLRFGDSEKESAIPRMRKFLQGVNAPALDEDWALVLRGKFEGRAINPGTRGFLYGSSVTRGTGGSYNLFYSELNDTTITHMGGVNLLNSRLNNVKGTVYQSSLTIEGCYLKNVEINANNGATLTFKNCTFENSFINSGYWVGPLKIKFINCVVKNTEKPIIRTASYSVGDIEFENCLIETGKSPAVFLYDLRAQKTDSQPGTIRFKKCDLINSDGYFVGMGGRSPAAKNVKVITVEALGSVLTKDGKPMLNKECVVRTPSPVWKINVSEARTLEMIHRGWDEATGKKIDELLKDLQ